MNGLWRSSLGNIQRRFHAACEQGLTLKACLIQSVAPSEKVWESTPPPVSHLRAVSFFGGAVGQHHKALVTAEGTVLEDRPGFTRNYTLHTNSPQDMHSRFKQLAHEAGS